MEIKACNTYAARPAGTAIYRNGKHFFKVYYADIYGRENRERTEWDLCGRERESVIELLAKADVEGVGCVVAFPHVTKVFRFAPSMETVMQVRGFWTEDFREFDLGREDGFVEFGCYAEAIIATDEYHFWAAAETVEEYMEKWSEWQDGPVVNAGKLGKYYG